MQHASGTPPHSVSPDHPPTFFTRSRWFAAAAVSVVLILEQATQLRVDEETMALFVAGGFFVATLGLCVGLFGLLEFARAQAYRAAATERARLVLAGLEGAALGVLSFVLEPFQVLERDHRAVIAAALCGVAGIAYRLLMNRSPRLAAAFALAVVVVALPARRIFGSVHYVSVHCALIIWILCSAARAMELLRPSAGFRQRTGLLISVVGLAVAHLVLDSSSAIRAGFYADTTIGRALVRPFGMLLDVDRDGGVSAFGSVDCAPFTASSGPFSFDIPGDGIDQDCEWDDAVSEPPSTSDGVPSETRFDVYLLSVDGLRWDVAPRFIKTAAALGEHMKFSLAVSPSPRTMNSFASVLRGRLMDELPSSHESLRASLLPNEIPTIGDAFQRHGYRAVYVPPHAYLAPSTGIVTGFEEAPMPAHVKAYNRRGDALEVSTDGDDALASLLSIATSTNEPLVAMTHLMETHTPYRSGRNQVFGTNRAAYLRAVEDTDARIASFINDLRRLRGRPAFFVLLGDHGEAFREHGDVNHSSSVHSEQVRVALWLAGPGINSGRVDAPVSTAALPATLLELNGLPAEPSFSVPSLAPCLLERVDCPESARSDLFVVQRPSDLAIRGWTTARHRIVVDRAHDWARVYDVEADPYEHHPRTMSASEAFNVFRADLR